jgi:hypothetical protein
MELNLLQTFFTYDNRPAGRKALRPTLARRSGSWDCSRSPVTTEGSSEPRTVKINQKCSFKTLRMQSLKIINTENKSIVRNVVIE